MAPVAPQREAGAYVMTARACILYRWWDADDNLLYVGKSTSVLARIGSHKRYSSFFDRAVKMTMERYPDQLSLAEAEVRAIRAEHPPYNIVHNGYVEMPDDPELEQKMHVEMAQAIDEILAPIVRGLKERAS